MVNLIAEELGEDPAEMADGVFLGRADRDQIAASLADEPSVQEALDWLWPQLTPQRLLAELFATPELLREARRRKRAEAAGAGARRRGRRAAADGCRDRPAASALRAAGRRPTSRCWTRPRSCWATSDTARGRGAGRGRAAGPDRLRAGRAGGGRGLPVDRPGGPARGDRHRRGPGLGRDAGRAVRGGGRPQRRRARDGRPDLDLRARHRGRGAGALADGLAAADAALPGAVDDAGRGRGADRRPGRRGVLGHDAGPARRRPVAAGGADGELPHALGDHGRGRGGAAAHRPGSDAAALGALQRRGALRGCGCRRLRWLRRSPSWRCGRTRRWPPERRRFRRRRRRRRPARRRRCRGHRTAGGAGAGRAARRGGRGGVGAAARGRLRLRPGPGAAHGGAAGAPGEGAGVRHGAGRRPGRDRRRPARRERPLRRADPGHPAAGHRRGRGRG